MLLSLDEKTFPVLSAVLFLFVVYFIGSAKNVEVYFVKHATLHLLEDGVLREVFSRDVYCVDSWC